MLRIIKVSCQMGWNRQEIHTPVTLITGGTEGIGWAFAKECASHGQHVLLIARDAKRLQGCQQKLEQDYPVKAYGLACDLTDNQSCYLVQNFLAEHRLKVHTLINNAGTGLSGDFAEHGAGQVNTLLNLNIRATTNLVHCFLPRMLEDNQGHILNVASTAGMLGLPYHALYAASKSYLISLSQALSHEVRGTGVTVSVLVPGPVDTGFHHKMSVSDAAYLKLLPMNSPETIARVGFNGLSCGQKFITPGIINTVNVYGAKFIPHGWLQSLFSFLWRIKSKRKHANVT